VVPVNSQHWVVVRCFVVYSVPINKRGRSSVRLLGTFYEGKVEGWKVPNLSIVIYLFTFLSWILFTSWFCLFHCYCKFWIIKSITPSICEADWRGNLELTLNFICSWATRTQQGDTFEAWLHANTLAWCAHESQILLISQPLPVWVEWVETHFCKSSTLGVIWNTPQVMSVCTYILSAFHLWLAQHFMVNVNLCHY